MADEARSLKAYGELPESSARARAAAAGGGERGGRRGGSRRVGFGARRRKPARAAPPGCAAQRRSAAQLHCAALRYCAARRRPPRCALHCALRGTPLTHACVRACASLPLRLSVRVNETDTFDEERGENDDFFDFDDVAEI
jgi:hypothetical protein